MAMISLTVDGSKDVTWADDIPALLTIRLEKWLGEGECRTPYAIDDVNLHGSVADFRALADKILAVLPAQPAVDLIANEPEPIENAIAEVLS